jgi:hypothetical protein
MGGIVLILGKIKSMEPTANAVLEMLKPINIVLVTTSSEVEGPLPIIN